MKWLSERNTLITFAALIITAIASINVGKADEGDNRQPLRGRVVALARPSPNTVHLTIMMSEAKSTRRAG
jgi:hypothetical protein